MDKPKLIRTEAWLLRGISSLPGMLELADGNLSFTAFGSGNFWGFQVRKLEQETGKFDLAQQLDEGEEVVLFETPLAAVQEVKFPWYFFLGGVRLTAQGVRYTFGFSKPANTNMPADRIFPAEALGGVVEDITGISDGRRRGKAWKSVLME